MLKRKEIPFVPMQEAIIQRLRLGAAAPKDIAVDIAKVTDNLLSFGKKPGGSLYMNIRRLENGGFIQPDPPDQPPLTRGRERTIGLTEKGKEVAEIRRKAACAIYDAIPAELVAESTTSRDATLHQEFPSNPGINGIRKILDFVDANGGFEKTARIIELVHQLVTNIRAPQRR